MITVINIATLITGLATIGVLIAINKRIR